MSEWSGAVRRDWRDSLRDASDLALAGFLVALGSLGVVTVAAVVATASAAISDWYDGAASPDASGRFPSAATTWRRFRRALLPGVPASLVGLAVFAVLVLDLAAARAGAVPGGVGLTVATSVVAVVVAGFGGLVVVEIGRGGGTGWTAAARWAWRTSVSRPVVPLALGAVGAVTVLLCILLPMCAPVLAGYLIFAGHVLAARLAPPQDPDDHAL